MKYLVTNGNDCLDGTCDTLQHAFDMAIEFWGEDNKNDLKFYEVKELEVNITTTIKEVATIKEKR